NRNKPAETTKIQPSAPSAPPPAAPQQPQPQPQPQPPPPPPPLEDPPFKGPTGFYRVWAKPVDDERSSVKMAFGADGRTVFVAGNARVAVFDKKPGEARTDPRGPGFPIPPQHMWDLARDRVAVFGSPLRAPVLWTAKPGEALPALLAQAPLPP